jgi:peptidyl-prolyl cis-trans isomerase A (cyclophilin A)
MFKHSLKKSVFLPSLFVGSLGFAVTVNATIVEFQTSQGTFQVNLFDQTTPKTVTNFLTYLDEGHYTNSLVHRVAPSFVVQGGGYEFNGELPLAQKEASRTVINEPVYSNVKGTIAMAKVGGNPDSASDQWFFNLNDNSSNLDLQNAGFSVFGQVIGDGMAVIEKIASATLCNAGNLEGIPVVFDNTDMQCSDLTAPSIDNFIVIEHITIVDSSEVTDADLSPVKNTLITAQPEPEPPTTPSNSGGGGSFAWLSLFGLALFTMKKRLIKG